jgi:hypothetical protein
MMGLSCLLLALYNIIRAMASKDTRTYGLVLSSTQPLCSREDNAFMENWPFDFSIAHMRTTLSRSSY